jgi:hypothetical protein
MIALSDMAAKMISESGAQESAAQVPVSASAGEHPTPSTPDAADRVAESLVQEILELKS